MVHLVDWLGRVVTEHLASQLIQVQSVVREHFGWNYDDDLSSANKMSVLFPKACMAGVSLRSEPLTEWPRSAKIRPRADIPIPPIPMK